MKRRKWWLALFAPQAMAQMGRGRSCVGVGTTTPTCKPTNNECPVCGTMAVPFTVPKSDKCYTFVSNMPSSSVWSVMDIPICPPEWTLVSRPYRQNITRCVHCNAAFWQDAEEK